MSEYRITIEVDENGNPTYSPSALTVKTDDTVQWFSTAGPFAITFLEHSPFRGASFRSQSGERGPFFTAPRAVQPSMFLHHHYSAAVADISRGLDALKVSLDAGCPEIVVSNDGA